MKLIKTISEIKKTGSYSLFLRHGDRNKIPIGEFGNEIELNETGFKRSFDFGNEICKFNINKLYASPIKRCIQTAVSIKQGSNLCTQLEISKLLGDPGPFVLEGKEGGESYLQLGFEPIYNKMLNYEAVPGWRDIACGSDILKNFFTSNSEKGKVNIYISHDMIIALYSFHVFGKKYTLDNWVNYLNGLIIQH